ncbi:HAMP domain-containing histidine kinase [Clostridium tagluense]|uniref:sensor histidine kinase n=1 Tax=Clostridium tagluense TaxID=360422 RepID=UPI001CF50FBB|nr:HAMP domain-containing sensor histidine kinase [Clostridium tagluense]MCB2312621.1 HAMP domain-containing histidine kinase [Clostridium tagluense]MCB2317297.1 HAMP domain-containing histidine kinase [Clostridium tagluense]MCB2322164.1 HAMP domain-containing histidine kinase [Clostridium tagluense]MCB2327093.1 HAMP domain-containing histidine kinase [Clostridium tagluense]MCB2331811.1 HAMP domain-containing histidine kinase [Clostridium tagluense]
MKIGIKNKIVIMNIAILLPVLLIVCLITIGNLYKNILGSSITMLKQESYNSQLNIITYLENEKNVGLPVLLKNMGPFIAKNLSDHYKFRIQLYNKDGLVGDSEEYPIISENKDVVHALSGTKSYIIKKIQNKEYILFSSPLYFEEETIGCFRYIYPLDKEIGLVKNTSVAMLLLGILALFFSVFLSNIFSRKIVSPIVSLKRASQKVANGDFTNTIEIDTTDEIKDLAESFNLMSTNISNSILKLKDEKANQKRFLDNVTHELKTPITSIIGYADLLPRVKTQEDKIQCCDYIQKGGQRLLCLVEELLNLSKLNKEDFQMEAKQTNIKLVIEESLLILKPRLEKYNISIETLLFDHFLCIDEQRTEQVFLNILDNAIKYSDCTSIVIKMFDAAGPLIVSISDNGEGIPKEHLEKIFEPFYTANKTLQNQYGGMGLGLAICKEIMKKEQGDISISSDKGTKVELFFELLQS